MQVLVVDDEQLVRWFLERALKRLGYGVQTVSSIDEALKIIANKGVDLLFTDLRMPGGNGTSLIKKVRELPTNMKVVVCSAFITDEMIKDFNERGIFTLKKPFKLSELENILKLVGVS